MPPVIQHDADRPHEDVGTGIADEAVDLSSAAHEDDGRDDIDGRGQAHGVEVCVCYIDEAQRRLRAIPGIGAWTLACMALRGQGDPDASPSGDLGLLKSVGRLMADGRVAAPAGIDPTVRDERERLPLATEEQVHALVSRYAPWRGYAAEHLLRA